MGCNCGDNEYNIRVDNNGSCEPTTPIYNITLGNVGVDGYSPTLDVVDETSSAFKIQVVNKSSTVTSPAIPKFDYLTNTYVSNTSLANTLSAYSTTAQINTALADKLNKDGSNADSHIIINGNNIWNGGILTPHLYVGSIGNGLQLGGNSIAPYSSGNETVMLKNYHTSTFQRDAYIEVDGNGNIYLGTTNPYKAYYNSKEIATVDQIPTVGNGTIIITQGGVTKGSFTTNQSGNTTIDLDAGGSSITNPLVISNQAEDRTLSLGIDENNDKVLFNYSIGGVINVPIPLLYSASQPLVLTERSADGLYDLTLNIDNDTIKVNQDGQLYADVQGGSSYTEGTGIDITNDTISVDESVVMTTSNQSTINFGAKQFSNVTVDNGFNTGVGLIGKKNASGTLYLAQVSTSDDIILGDNTAPLYLMGSNNRPKYTGGNTLAEDLALYSDIPDVSNFVTNSSLATTLAGYVDLTSNQTVGGNKTFTGTNYLRNTYICNASGTYFGRIRAVDNKFTLEGIGTDRSINFIPNGAGQLQYNGVEVATVSDIPTVNNPTITFTQGGVTKGTIKLNQSSNQTIALDAGGAVDSVNGQTGTVILTASDVGALPDNTTIGDAILTIQVNSSTIDTFTANATSNKSINIQCATPSQGSLADTALQPNDNISKLTNNAGYITNSALNGYATETYVDTGLATKQDTLTEGSGIDISGGITTVNPLVTLPLTVYENGSDKIFNASDTSYDGAVIYGKWDSGSVVVFSGDSASLRFGYGFYWSNDSLVAMARYDYQYATLETISNIPYQSDFYYKIQFFQDGTVDMYYSLDGITYELAISTTTASGGVLYGQDIYVCGGNNSILAECSLLVPTGSPTISCDNTIARVTDIPTNNNQLTNGAGYITGITSGDVTTALGYTPYNSSNPNGYQANVIETVKVNGTALTVTSKAVDVTVPTKVSDLTNDSGYTTNVGTVTKVNNTSPDSNGNVTITIPTVPTNISAFTNDSGYITGITSSNVTTALGYTPADTDLSNLSATGKTVLDGQWVNNSVEIYNGSVSNSSTLTKTVTLPNDGKVYEVLISVEAETGASSGNFTAILLKSNVLTDYTSVCAARTRSNSSVIGRGNVIIPMKYGSNNLTIYRSTSYSGTALIKVIAYRRCGTNT